MPSLRRVLDRLRRPGTAAGDVAPPGPSSAGGATPASGGSPPVERASMVGRGAPVVIGVAVGGTLAALQPSNGAVVFLTSSCLDCRSVWEAVAAGRAAADGIRIAALVTPDATLEDRGAVVRLAPDPEVAATVMSTATWHAYGVRGSPWVAVVVAGLVVAEGPATCWADVVTLTTGRPQA